MREIRAPSLKVILVTIFIALLTTVTPILATDYTVGVKVGDWIKYGEINVSEPSLKVDWMKMEVKNVSGTKVSVETTRMYNGTTERSSNSTIDIAIGGFSDWLIAADLKEGDSISQQSSHIKINDTVTRTYCGASRSVNFVNLVNITLTISSGGATAPHTVKVYWDKATGVMVEYNMSRAKTTPTAYGMELSFKATETNIWSPDILGLISNNLIYIAGIAVLVVIIVVCVFIVRRRKPTPTVTPTPTPVEEKPATPT